MTPAYEGPLRDEPLPVELSNTLYAARGTAVDGLADATGLRAWLTGLRDRLPADPAAVEPARLPDFHALREAVRETLRAALEQRSASAEAVDVLNAVSERGKHWLVLTQHGDRRTTDRRYASGDAADAVLGRLAEDTMTLVAGRQAELLRACGAPGCILLFVKDHPRREWCSAGCGNRARQARHYARHRRSDG